MRCLLVLYCCLMLSCAVPARAADCNTPPPPVRDLDLSRFYGDDAGTVVDPARAAQHQAEAEPVRTYLSSVVSEADKSLRRAKPAEAEAHARCALDWLASWARGGALLGAMKSKQAEYERNWMLAGLALAYLKVKPAASADQQAAIEPWLLGLADRARAMFDDPGRKRNNHWYWLGLGLGATAMATGSDRHWTAARGIADDAAHDIAPDGSLPQEMQRGARALHYHAFAVMPLVVLAELARARGEDFAGLRGGALDRLVALTVRGLQDPALFDRQAGVTQERPVKPGAGWLRLYLQRALPISGPPIEMAPGHRWLGGDVMLLSKALSRSGR
jgi:poly(beta-D-mannuronate) lyase